MVLACECEWSYVSEPMLAMGDIRQSAGVVLQTPMYSYV